MARRWGDLGTVYYRDATKNDGVGDSPPTLPDEESSSELQIESAIEKFDVSIVFTRILQRRKKMMKNGSAT